jgi:cytochrome oxidase Cu insertion factor (SCO1/SenC/PrrC family)
LLPKLISDYLYPYETVVSITRPPFPNSEGVLFMALIAAGATAPDFTLDSHLDTTVSLSDFKGKKNVLFVSYPLDFTPT